MHHIAGRALELPGLAEDAVAAAARGRCVRCKGMPVRLFRVVHLKRRRPAAVRTRLEAATVELVGAARGAGARMRIWRKVMFNLQATTS